MEINKLYMNFGISEYKEERWTNAGLSNLKNIYSELLQDTALLVEG